MNFLKLFLFGALLAAAAGGYWMGKEEGDLERGPFPTTESKPFVLIVYACNQASWCEKSLKSIFGQDYENYRVILIDDASSDETFNFMEDFLTENKQEDRAILIRNERRLGPIGSLFRAIENCRGREIAVPLDAKNWLTDPSVLNRLNQSYQDPEIWSLLGQAIDYPSYEKVNPPRPSSPLAGLDAEIPVSFYAGILKQISQEELFKEGRFAEDRKAYLVPLLQLAKGHWRALAEPLAFSNSAFCSKEMDSWDAAVSYEPLSGLPEN